MRINWSPCAYYNCVLYIHNTGMRDLPDIIIYTHEPEVKRDYLRQIASTHIT